MLQDHDGLWIETKAGSRQELAFAEFSQKVQSCES